MADTDAGTVAGPSQAVKWRFGLAVVSVAIVTALFAIAFRETLSEVVGWLGGSDIVSMIANAPMWERVVLPAAGGLGAGLIGLAMARRKGGGGVGYVMEAIVLGRSRIPVVRSVLQALASWLAIATGNSLGREGPLITFGAAAGEGARRAFQLDDATARLVLAAGVAAGFASAYNAPIAATLFVVEVVTGVMVLEAAVTILVASVIATVVTRFVIGAAPLYGLRNFSSPAAIELLAYAGLGLIAAPVGVGFLRLLSFAERGWRRLPMPFRPTIGGATCGAILCLLPAVAGNGFEPLQALLDGRIALAGICWLLLAKPLATAASVSSGNPGGVFTPTLLVGACLGALFAIGLHEIFGGAISSTGSYALVGLAAALAATTHAPLTSAILACELSGDYALVLPLLIACAIAAGLARHLYIDSVYTAELTRRGIRWRLTLDGRRVAESQQDDYVI
ncbi:MAG: Chloride channel protein [Myxococcales bacterium]|nr:Chloride channel protein [Myxococcales bacterium]